MRAWMRATFRRALLRLREPFCLRNNRCCALASRFSSRRKNRSFPTFSPVLMATVSSSPRSIPTVALTTGNGATSSSVEKGDEVAASRVLADGDAGRVRAHASVRKASAQLYTYRTQPKVRASSRA